ncbi:MAG: precorrin-2 C(20)-methyltransferase [Deltaproteobacteria bacterium]|nr:precorrin-2 C(20)-methyltransferase [Deltaproteobacteria bacterium]
MRSGIFYGVGVGPGDPELMTLKAVSVLKAAPVLAVPRSADSKGEASLALSIVEKAVRLDEKELLDLPLPMTKDKAVLLKARQRAASRVVERLSSGLDVAFITLGDALLYSTFSYLVPLVREEMENVEVRVVPGIMAMSAAASALAMPLAEADEQVRIMPASYAMDEAGDALDGQGTIVFMKVNKVFDGLRALLREKGLLENAALVSHAGWPDEKITRDLSVVDAASLDYFSIVIVRKGDLRASI